MTDEQIARMIRVIRYLAIELSLDDSSVAEFMDTFHQEMGTYEWVAIIRRLIERAEHGY